MYVCGGNELASCASKWSAVRSPCYVQHRGRAHSTRHESPDESEILHVSTPCIIVVRPPDRNSHVRNNSRNRRARLRPYTYVYIYTYMFPVLYLYVYTHTQNIFVSACTPICICTGKEGRPHGPRTNPIPHPPWWRINSFLRRPPLFSGGSDGEMARRHNYIIRARRHAVVHDLPPPPPLMRFLSCRPQNFLMGLRHSPSQLLPPRVLE